MKTRMRLALLLAAILPIALSAVTTDELHPVAVPDAASTLLLLGAGLGALVAVKKKLFAPTR